MEYMKVTQNRFIYLSAIREVGEPGSFIRPTEIFSERREVIIGNRDLTEVNPAMYYK